MSEIREWTTATETAEIAALKARIVELEHERDRAMRVVACAVSLVSRAEGLAAQTGGLGHAHVDAGNYDTLRRVTAPYREGAGDA